MAKVAKTLTADEWQFAKRGRKHGTFEKVVPEPDDEPGPTEWKTQVVDDACIFLNRPDFKHGAGLRAAPPRAQHRQALQRATSPRSAGRCRCGASTTSRTTARVISRLTEFGRDGWGEGGEDFGWWCTEAPEAFLGTRPVYESMEVELRKMLGKKLYKRVAEYLDGRRRTTPPPVMHPSEVPVTLGKKRKN